MRKLLVAVLALAAVVAVASVAIAANTYEVHVASTKPVGKGSVKKPLPTAVNFGFKVGETDATKRATVIETYAIGSEGLVTNPNLFDKANCKFSDINKSSVPSKCKGALVGKGYVRNAAGPSTDQSLEESLPCNLTLRLYAVKNGMVLRLDGGPPGPTSFSDTSPGRCPLPIGTAINGKFVKTRIGGLPASDYRFTVPQNLKHPVTGTDNSVRESVTNVAKKVKFIRVRGKRVARGFYQSIGCKGRTRTVRATFTTERTATSAPQTFTATTQGKC